MNNEWRPIAVRRVSGHALGYARYEEVCEIYSKVLERQPGCIECREVAHLTRFSATPDLGCLRNRIKLTGGLSLPAVLLPILIRAAH